MSTPLQKPCIKHSIITSNIAFLIVIVHTTPRSTPSKKIKHHTNFTN